jgi:hypothetical protein
VIELERTVSAAGNISLGDHAIGAGLPLAGQRVTLRLEGPVAHILADRTLVRTLACPVPEEVRPRLRGARAGTASRPQLPEPQKVLRRVSAHGTIMVGGQRIQVGFTHAGKTADVTIDADTYHVTIDDRIAVTAPRATSRDIRRHKASRYDRRGFAYRQRASHGDASTGKLVPCRESPSVSKPSQQTWTRGWLWHATWNQPDSAACC